MDTLFWSTGPSVYVFSWALPDKLLEENFQPMISRLSPPTLINLTQPSASSAHTRQGLQYRGIEVACVSCSKILGPNRPGLLAGGVEWSHRRRTPLAAPRSSSRLSSAEGHGYGPADRCCSAHLGEDDRRLGRGTKKKQYKNTEHRSWTRSAVVDHDRPRGHASALLDCALVSKGARVCVCVCIPYAGQEVGNSHKAYLPIPT